MPSKDRLAEKVLSLDISYIQREIKFFYPFEVQVIDEESYRINTEGEASHLEYKKAQQVTAMARLFRQLLELKGLPIPHQK